MVAGSVAEDSEKSRRKVEDAHLQVSERTPGTESTRLGGVSSGGSGRSRGPFSDFRPLLQSSSGNPGES